MRNLFLIAVCIVIIAGTGSFSSGHELGRFGRTYGIVEPDALEEMEAKAKSVNWGEVFGRKKWETKIKQFQPPTLKRLPTAKEDRTRLVDMTYTLPFDIPDGKGGILYPAGFTFNPLSYVFLPNVLVVIDGTRKDHIEWFRSLGFSTDLNTMLILSDGSYFEIMNKLKIPVYYLNEDLAERFQLEAVPSVIVQKGTLMEVTEYSLK